MWFHATRVHPKTSFDEGLRPLSQRVEHIWNELGLLAREWVSDDQWRRFRREMKGRFADQYCHKVAILPMGDGPFGVLVRDYPLGFEKNGCCDFIRIPEVVKDICGAFEESTRHQLQDVYTRRTQSCIVKFWSDDSRHNRGTTAYALRYAWDTIRAHTLAPCPCYDGASKFQRSASSRSSGFLDNLCSIEKPALTSEQLALSADSEITAWT
jgi:hypothetical protein